MFTPDANLAYVDGLIGSKSETLMSFFDLETKNQERSFPKIFGSLVSFQMPLFGSRTVTKKSLPGMSPACARDRYREAKILQGVDWTSTVVWRQDCEAPCICQGNFQRSLF